MDNIITTGVSNGKPWIHVYNPNTQTSRTTTQGFGTTESQRLPSGFERMTKVEDCSTFSSAATGQADDFEQHQADMRKIQLERQRVLTELQKSLPSIQPRPF